MIDVLVLHIGYHQRLEVETLEGAERLVGLQHEQVVAAEVPVGAEVEQFATNDGDYGYGIAKNSDAKEAAKAWITFFAEESGYAEAQGMVPTLLDAPLPENLSSFEEAGVTLIEPAAAPEGKESLLSDTSNEAGIDIYGQVYRQKLVDIARGAADGDKASYFAELNDKWAAAVEKLAG